MLLPAVIGVAAFGLAAAVTAGGRNRMAFLAASFTVFLILGIISYGLGQKPGILAGLEGREVRAAGRIATHPQQGKKYSYFRLSACRLEEGGSSYPIKEEIEIQAETDIALKRDEQAVLEGVVREGKLFCSLASDAGRQGCPAGLFRIRKRAYSCLKHSYHKYLSYSFAPICEALVLGNRSGIPQGIIEDFKGAGIYHVLAISGLHISVLAYFLMQLLKKAPGWLALLMLAGILVAFNLLVGLKASLLRASSMMIMVMLAKSWGRHYRIGDVFFTSFAFILLMMPSYFTDLGFWLSFASFASIIFIAPLFERLAGWPRNYFLKIITISFSIGLATLPLNAYFFGMYSLAAIFSNLAVLPVFYIFMVMLFSVSFLVIIWPPMGALLAAVNPLLAYITKTAHHISRLSFAVIDFSGFGVQAAAIYYVLLLSLLLLLNKYILVREGYGKE
ncbi:MAG: ComEC/Rec2 family competence protein [Actinomycetota bacterium]